LLIGLRPAWPGEVMSGFIADLALAGPVGVGHVRVIWPARLREAQPVLIVNSYGEGGHRKRDKDRGPRGPGAWTGAFPLRGTGQEIRSRSGFMTGVQEKALVPAEVSREPFFGGPAG
jgi:hypothetical protein